MVNIIKHDKLHIKIDTLDAEYIRNVKEHFTEYVENYMHMSKYKSGQWNGKVCLFNNNKTLPYGLLTDLMAFHKKNYPNKKLNISSDVLAIFKGNPIKLAYKLKYKPHDYQMDCIEAAIKYKSGIIVSSTASGKSLMISYILQNLMANNIIKKPIIIVPSTGLVEQFFDDLIDYGINANTIGRVYSKCKETTYDMPITISTWQTLQNKKTILANYDCVIVDEVHGVRGLELREILKHATNAEYRLGFTGTMPTYQLEVLNVKSYLGPILRTYTAGWLMEHGYISKCNINTFELTYKNDYDGTYNEVKDEVFNNSFRMNIIKNIVQDLDSNVLLLVGKVEKEGKVLKEYLDRHIQGKEVIFLWGDTSVEDREFWRKECGNRTDVVIIATYGIFQLGVNIPSLKYIVLASPFKSKIRVLQSIGRALRKHANKVLGATIFDIIDHVKYLETHGDKRMRYYNSEGFDTTEYNLNES